MSFMQPYLNSHYFVAPVRNRCIEWEGQIYAYSDGVIYVYDRTSSTFSKVEPQKLPSRLEIRDGGIYVKTDFPLEYKQTKYCICTSQDLFQKGCGCGGD